MRFRAILVSQDMQAVQLLTRVLRDLKVETLHCAKTEDARERLGRGRIDALIVDADRDDADLLLEAARNLPATRRTLGVVLSRSRAGQNPPEGAHIVLYKPISVERVAHGLRAIRNLMACERRSTANRVPVEIPASIRSDRMRRTDVVLVDLSEGGAALRASEPLPPCGLLTLECLLPETSAVMSMTAEIVWQDSKKQFGVRFVNIPVGSRSTLQNWLRGNAHLVPKEARGRGTGF